MENLAYLQVVLALESLPERSGWQGEELSNPWETVNWQGLSGPGYRRWLAIALNLSLFSLMQGALASHVIPTTGLGRGDSGPLVTCVQQMLKATGYFHGPVSGFYGPMTEQAVLKWEIESAGVGDGAVNASTVAQINCYQGQSSGIPDPSAPHPNPTPVALPDCPTPHPGTGTVRPGDRGERVVQLQRELIAAGYFKGPITGYYGAGTQDAVMHFQQDYHIPIDGVATPETLLQLAKRPEPSSFSAQTLHRGSQGSNVVYLQENLRNLGYYTGPVTGYYGQLTQAAVMELQCDRGIHADGVAGPQTQQVLVSMY